MLRISTPLQRIFTALVLTVLAAAGAVAADWPLNSTIDLSSGFGDYRVGHFHFGIDLRTGGVTGKQVLSPVDGSVWRVRTEYKGYGKALYIKGHDDHIYVLAHLKDFNRRIDYVVKHNQVADRRYYQDFYLPEDSLPVKAGEVVAFSGQTGSGAPHLHFEKRAGDYPLNPLSHGYTIDDQTRPVFTRLGIALTDDHSVLSNGRRKQFIDVRPTDQAGRYGLDTVLYIDRPSGLLAECYDMMRPKGMRQAIYDLSVHIDGKVMYRSRFDSLDFEANHAVSLEYDYVETTEDRKYVRRLFKKSGNVFAGSRLPDSNGVIRPGENVRYGPREVRIIGEDAFGNKSELRFTAFFAPSDGLFTLDSTIIVDDSTTDFYFAGHADAGDYRFDSIQVFLNRGAEWGKTLGAEVFTMAENEIRARVYGYSTELSPLRLAFFPEGGGSFFGPIFNGILEAGSARIRIEREIVEDGLLVTLNVSGRRAFQASVALFDGDVLLGVENPQFLNKTKYVCFIPPRKEYSRVDRISAEMTPDFRGGGIMSDTGQIFAVGFGTDEHITVDSQLILHFDGGTLYEPRFIELKAHPILQRDLLRLNSDHYEILPEAFATRREFGMTYIISRPRDINDRSGLCWLDAEKDRWVWLDNVYQNDTITAASLGGGSFAAVFDLEAPKITGLTLVNGRRYSHPRPPVNFVIEDTLSGIGDDRDIVIKLDGQWLIPEYEPETGQVRSGPLEPLEPGRHHLAIEVTDRAGNKTEQYLQFTVTKQ